MRDPRSGLLLVLVGTLALGCGASPERTDAPDVASPSSAAASATASAAPSAASEPAPRVSGNASAKPPAKEVAKDGFCGKAVAPGAADAYARAKTLVDVLGAEGHPSALDMQRGMADLEIAADGGIREAEWDFGSVVFSTRFGDHAPRPDERDLYVRAFKHIRLAAIRGNERAKASFPDLAQPKLPQKLEEPLAQFDRSWIEHGVKAADSILACRP